MPRKKKPTPVTWTPDAIAALPPRANKYPVNLKVAGLYVIVHPTGTKRFATMQRDPVTTKVTYPVLGSFPELTLAQAIELAQAAASPEALARRSAEAAKLSTMTLGQLAADFQVNDVERRDVQPERKARIRQVLHDHFLNHRRPETTTLWRDITLASLRGDKHLSRDYRRTLLAAQDEATKLGDARGPSTLADRCDEFAQQMFAYACEEKYMSLDDRPAVIEDANQSRERTREITADELHRIFTAQAQVGLSEAARLFIRILAMTGFREESLVKARWSHIDAPEQGLWVVPTLKRTRQQKRAPRDHVIPILPQLRAELDALRAITFESGWLFPGQNWRRKLVNGLEIKPCNDSWASHIVTKDVIRPIIGNTLETGYYVGHDFRRTLLRTLISLGVNRDIAKIAAAHRLPGKLERTYFDGDVRPYVDEAFMKFNAYLDACRVGKGAAYRRALHADVLERTRAEIAARNTAIGL